LERHILRMILHTDRRKAAPAVASCLPPRLALHHRQVHQQVFRKVPVTFLGRIDIGDDAVTDGYFLCIWVRLNCGGFIWG
jgi:hypothetical protein